MFGVSFHEFLYDLNIFFNVLKIQLRKMLLLINRIFHVTIVGNYLLKNFHSL